jgi:pimeloyl-ACP methyl ester carboxylesterase
MSTYVLVHGAWHGGWCWDKIVPLLQQAGHTAVALDLPGHGKDQTPVSAVSLDAYVDRVREAVDAQAEPVILVGHSMAGVVISQTAEDCPDKLEALVYLCAFLPGNGESLSDWSRRDTQCLLPAASVVSQDRTYSMVREDAVKEIFYGDCADEDVTYAQSHLRPQATAPVRTPLRTTDENFGRVPRVYIETLHDRALSISLQRQMYTAAGCDKVITMDTSHSPFFSEPEVLAGHLLTVGISRTST